MRRFRSLGVGLFFLGFIQSAIATDVLLVSPSLPEDPFFSRVELYSQIAAKKMGFNFEVIYGGGHRIYQHAELTTRLRENRPDYIILQVYSGSGEALFELMSNYPDVKIITLERLLFDDEAKAVGEPGQLHANWIGELLVDNQAASLALTRYLLAQCKVRGEEPPIGVVGLNGFNGYEAEQRKAGLLKGVSEDAHFTLHQVVNSKWQRDTAQQQAKMLVQRYPDTRVFWAASDWMALGVFDVLKAALPEQRFCIGGFDWLPDMLDAIYRDKTTASVGGHFLMGVWALVMIRDHLTLGQTPRNMGSVQVEMAVITRENVEDVSWLLEPGFWRTIDLSQFSRSANPQGAYNFSLQSLLDSIKRKRHDKDEDSRLRVGKTYP